MTFLPHHKVERLLGQIREIAKNVSLVDIHVHGTEVIFDSIEYSSASEGLLTAGCGDYSRPRTSRIRLDAPSSTLDQEVLNKVSKVAFTRAYQHTGTRVLTDHMELAGLGKAVLLPVSRKGFDFGKQWALLRDMASQSESLYLGYCIPESVATSDIASHLRDVHDRCDIRMLKIHPNLSNISLVESSGRDRIHSMLSACGELKIPCLVHGGCSPILHGLPCESHAAADNLSNVDWSLTNSPVVIAHFGAYGCNADMINDASISRLTSILEAYPNTWTDTSGVSYPVVRKMLEKIDRSRIVFGSDALYLPMWQAIVQIVHAAESIFGEFEATLLQIASKNSHKVLGFSDYG